MSQKKVNLPVVNPHAAGIDIGSRVHFVAVGQNSEDVKSFGCYTNDLVRLSRWLKSEGVTSVAMESTGSYWKGVFQQLQHDGFEVILVNGKHTHNVKGKKTDVLDCQWIQRLHSLGLLSGSFLPDEFTTELRQYARNREQLIEQAGAYATKMKQALRLMNIRLDVAIRDITGESGRAIVSAILQGQRDPAALASLANFRVKKSKQEIASSLEGNWREEYLFELRLSQELFDIFQQKIAECDKQIDQLLKKHLQEKAAASANTSVAIVKKKINKNAPKLPLQQLSIQLTGGINLYEVEGVSDATVLAILSETGFDLSKFPTAKHFSSWMALSPNNKISGGKILSSHVAHHNNKLAQALRRAANAIGNMKTGKLNQFFKRIAFKYGRMAAITATARKLSVIIWNMLTKKEPYRYEETTIYVAKLRRLQLKSIQRKIRALNIQQNELNFVNV
ncbi:MAG: family transposase [Flavipsychrobacter sp.]|jgi:transposase|nr:family transposase [Flavipsychrobacter sp.]